MVWKVSGQSGKFLKSLESFRTGEKVSGQCGMFLDTLVFFGQFSDILDQFTHFDICRENNLRTFGTNVAGKNYALRPESFCASKSADRKVETF